MGDDRAGYLVEIADTVDIFTNPKNQLTEDYVSGPVRLSTDTDDDRRGDDSRDRHGCPDRADHPLGGHDEPPPDAVARDTRERSIARRP